MLFDHLRGTHERIEKETVDLRALIQTENVRLTSIISDTHTSANSQHNDYATAMRMELDGMKNLLSDNALKVATLQGQFAPSG